MNLLQIEVKDFSQVVNMIHQETSALFKRTINAETLTNVLIGIHMKTIKYLNNLIILSMRGSQETKAGKTV